MTVEAAVSPERRTRDAVCRVDDIDVRIVRGEARGTSLGMVISPPANVTAAAPVVLPAFEGWISQAEFRVTVEGRATAPLEIGLEVGGTAVGAPVKVELAPADARGTSPFAAELRAPLAGLRGTLGRPAPLAILVWTPKTPALPPRRLALGEVVLVPIASPGPSVQTIDLSDVTDAELYGGPERRSFDLANPEEGFWKSSGRALLSLSLTWSDAGGSAYVLDRRLERLSHAFSERAGDGTDAPLVEDVARRSSTDTVTRTELIFDTGHPALGEIPQEGADVPFRLEGTHLLSFSRPGTGRVAEIRAKLTWTSGLGVRVRDPRPLLKTFQRLSAVGIDFGTSATVAALVQRGYRSLLQLGRPVDAPRGPTSSRAADESVRAAENPVFLLVDDHEALWREMSSDERFPHLVRVLRGSHAALAKRAESPNSVVGQIKSLPDRVVGNDESPQLRDRERQRDFLLDEPRVRMLVRAYAYFLGRAINRPGQDIYLHYVLTHPSKSDAKSRALIDQEMKKGLLLSLPEDVPAEELRVEVVASEAEAFAVEVCPELCAHPDVAELVEKHGQLRFVVFDLGGGTLDVACGVFRPATEAEQGEHGSSTVIETLQVNGEPDLGGEMLTHELAWLVHQDESVLPEMEAKEVPMMRPPTVPINHLARRPELYKRGLAARQNWLRIDSALGLERVKFGPAEAPRPAPGLSLARLDGSETTVDSLAFGGSAGAKDAAELPRIAGQLRSHLLSRIKEGTKLLASTIASAKWPGDAADASKSLLDRGILVLLAGNSSRSAFVAQAVAEELGLAKPGEPFEPWRPEGSNAPLRGVVLFETPARMERGVSVVGVTPKTAVALGALKLANNEVHLVRATQGFGYFLGDLRGFPPKFTAIVPMGAPSGSPNEPGPHVFDFGRWDTKTALRVSREYVAGKMTSNDPRVFLVPTGLPPGHVGRLYVAVVAPDEIVLCLDRSQPAGADGAAPGPALEPLVSELNLAKALR